MNLLFDILLIFKNGFNKDVKIYVSDFMFYFKIVKNIVIKNI